MFNKGLNKSVKINCVKSIGKHINNCRRIICIRFPYKQPEQELK